MLPAIVMIEDNLVQTELVLDILAAKPSAQVVGHFVSGRRFFDWLEASSPLPHIDIILLDMRLPGEPGYDLLPKIRAYPGLEKVRVLAVTANILPPDVDRARQAGFDGFIGKPVDPDTLPKYIEYAMRGTTIWRPL